MSLGLLSMQGLWVTLDFLARDSKSVVPRVSQEPICLADVAQPVRDNKLALHIKEKV